MAAHRGLGLLPDPPPPNRRTHHRKPLLRLDSPRPGNHAPAYIKSSKPQRHVTEPLPGLIAAAPNDTWQTAQPFQFGQTIYGSDDERPYAPSQERRRLRRHAQRLPMVQVHV